MSDNWIVQNLNSALQTWSDKLAEIWTLLTQSPENFKGGAIWSVMTNINGGLKAIGYGLLVLFFAAGLVKTCGSFTDMKKPEHVVKAFIRFALAQGAVMSGMELLTAIFSIVQGIVTNIMSHSGMAGNRNGTALGDRGQDRSGRDAGIYPFVDRNFIRKPADYGIVICHDSDCIRENV